MFSMNVVSTYFALWITVDNGMSDFWVGAANSTSMLLVALTLPVLGVLSDLAGRRVPYLIVMTIVSCAATAAIGVVALFMSKGALLAFLSVVFFVVANYAYQGGLVFYNALLPDVVSGSSMGKISGQGVAFGYLGAIVGLLMVEPFVTGEMRGLRVPFPEDWSQGRGGAFIPTAVLFLVFSLPIFFFVRERARTSARLGLREKLGLSLARVREALLNTAKFPGVRRFLVAKYLYEDAISTVIIFMAVYSVKVVGMKDAELITFFIVSTLSAMAGGFLTGAVVDRLGARRTLEISLLLWIACLVAIALVQDKRFFWIMGSLVGICLGSTWTSERPFFIALVPRELLGEFFGLYALSGKIAAIVGPLLWGATVYLLAPYGTVAYRAAVLSLAAMALAGLLVLRKIK
jgi:UMF1 family MFS transporter